MKKDTFFLRKRRKIGVLLLTLSDPALPGGKRELTAYLQKRGEWHFAKNRKQSWRGICQVTAEGKINDLEAPLTALLRKVEDRLGEGAGKAVRQALLGTHLKERLIHESEWVTTYGLVVQPRFIRTIRPEPFMGGLVRVRPSDLKSLVNARPEWRLKDHGKKGTVVFPETKAALLEAFRKFSQP